MPHRTRTASALERAAARYLDLLGSALLDEHYLDHEVRLEYLVACIENRRSPSPAKLRDPRREMKTKVDRLDAARRSGARSSLPYTDMGRVRLMHLQRCLDTVRSEPITGDLLECGTGRGGSAIFMRGYLEAHELPDRLVWVADQFRVSEEPSGPLLDLSPDLNIVRDGFAAFGFCDERVRFLQGAYAETLAAAPIGPLALLHIGAGLGPLVGDVLEATYERLATGAPVIVDDADPTSRQAVDRFRADHGITEPLQRVDATAVMWLHTKRRRLVDRLIGVRRATGAPTNRCDLTVIASFFNQRREAARTLHSLSRAYQRGIEALDYEVIVVENGSADDQRLGAEYVASFGPQFRYLDMGTDATPSPVPALNRAVDAASGRVLAFMIDGACVLTPGVLHHTMVGITSYAPAVVATQPWFVGPGQQSTAMAAGYDMEYEDRLFDDIGWPTDGYRLFEVGHFVHDRDWLDRLWGESDCFFVPKAVVEQAGSFDERFAMVGGGLANLDFYERIGSTPGVNIVMMLGEATFHQLHGGTTTNVPDADERGRLVTSFHRQYEELRGRAFKGPAKDLHYVGTMFPSALRTRARSTSTAAFRRSRPSDRKSPVPEALAAEFIDAFWHSRAWETTTWLGLPVATPPTDLFVYQELVSRSRPDWIVDIGTGCGGRAAFLASICELLNHGSVVSVDPDLRDDVPHHSRIVYVTGTPHEDETVAKVRATVGNTATALVILGSAGSSRDDMVRQFDAYHDFVAVGSYVVMENTILNGHPVWPEFGPGPREAARACVRLHDGFIVDPTLEKYALTFNPRGYLKRVT